MAVQHQIDRVGVDDPAQFGVAEHPPLRGGFGAQGAEGRREMGHGDANRGLKGGQGSIEALAFAAGADGERAKGATVGHRGVVLGPEAAAAPGGAGDADPNAAGGRQFEGIALQQANVRREQRLAERLTSQPAPIVVAHHGHNRQSEVGQQPGGHVRFGDAPALGDVAGDHEQVRLFPRGKQRPAQGDRRGIAQMEIADCRHPNRGAREGTIRRRDRSQDACLHASIVPQGGTVTAVRKGKFAVVDRVGGKLRRGGRTARFVLASVLMLVVVTGWSLGSAGASPWTPQAWTAPAPPPVTAKAAFVYDATAGVPLLALNPDEPLQPASLTKIVTAIVVLEHGNLDDTIEIVPGDVVDESQSRVGLVAGDVLSVRDLLSGLMIPSGNDAALALARHVGASLPGGADGDPTAAFVAEMNRAAAERGATTANFVNPTGMFAEEQRVSARDLALLTADAVADPLLAEIVATPRLTLPSVVRPEGYEIFTTNDLLVDGTAIGVKTGSLPEAGGCLVIATREGENLVISVVLGSDLTYEDGVPISPARWSDMRGLLAAIDQDYVWIDPAAPGAVPGLPEELAVWGAMLPVGGAVPVPSDRAGDLAYRLRLGPPADPGDRVGTVLLLVGSDLLAERPVQQAGFVAGGQPAA